MSAAHEDTTGSGLGGVSGGGLEGGATSAGGTGGTGGTSSAGAGGGATASGALAAGLGGLAGRLPNGGASLLNRLAEGSPLPVHDHLTPSTGGPIDYLRTQWGTDHLAAADPHAQYATDADLTAYATDADLAAHAAAADPHPVYLTPAEGDARFLTPAEGDGRYPLKTDPDPYPQYLTAAELPPATEVTVTTDASLTSTESPANTFGLAVRLSPDANNTVTLHANGLYAAAGAIPPEYVTDAELATALGPYATDADLAAHAGAADPHPGYLTAAEGDARFLTQTEGDGRYPLRTDPDPYPAYLTQTEGDARYTQGGLTQAAADLRYEPLDSAYTKTEADARYVPLTLPDARGDLLAASGADALGRLPLGTDGQVLTADSAAALGVKWAAAAGGGSGLPTTGGTMTGTITAQGAGVDGGGALVVVSPNVAVADARVYGATSPAFAPTAGAVTTEHGLRFTSVAAQYLVAVRWYRVAAGQAAPLSVRLWDTTSTATPVWSATTPAAWTDAGLGWKEHRLPAGTQPALVAGRAYALAYTRSGTTNQTQQAAYAPVADAGLTFLTHVTGSAGAYPATTSTTSCGLDGAVRTTLTAPTPAQSGALRLPNGTAGAVTWRSGNDGADLALSANASDQLVFNGAALLNQATADALFLTPAEGDAAYLNVTGDTATGALVLQGAASSANVLQAKLAADTQPRFRVDASGLHEWGPGGGTAPDTTLQRTGAQQLAANSTLTLSPAAGQAALSAGVTANGAGALLITGGAQAGTGSPRLLSATAGSWIEVDPPGNAFVPTRDNAVYCGYAGARWAAVYAAAGTINTSAAESKEDITPLDPAAALAAVLATDPVTFTYTAPAPTAEQYELPDDPEQAERVLHERLVNAPLMEAARSQAGFVLASPDYATDPLFETGAGQSNAANSAGVLLAALHEIDRRLTAGGL